MGFARVRGGDGWVYVPDEPDGFSESPAARDDDHGEVTFVDVDALEATFYFSDARRVVDGARRRVRTAFTTRPTGHLPWERARKLL